ncbi:MAG: hypothetical protein Q9215_006082, partial [Flavoplaca cf. flavocitrina]
PRQTTISSIAASDRRKHHHFCGFCNINLFIEKSCKAKRNISHELPGSLVLRDDRPKAVR